MGVSPCLLTTTTTKTTNRATSTIAESVLVGFTAKSLVLRAAVQRHLGQNQVLESGNVRPMKKRVVSCAGFLVHMDGKQLRN